MNSWNVKVTRWRSLKRKKRHGISKVDDLKGVIRGSDEFRVSITWKGGDENGITIEDVSIILRK